MDWTIVLEDSGTLLMKLKMYPYFEIAHYIIMCLYARDDIEKTQTGPTPLSRRHPLACWVSCMLMCFGGGMLAHFLLGEPVFDDFKTHQSLALASLIWFLVFYTPLDLFYKIVKFKPIKITLYALKETLRARKVYDGVYHAMHVYPNGYIIIVLVAIAKGAGSGFINVLDRLTRGVWLPHSNEFLHPSFPTKACLVSAILFLLEKKALLPVPKAILYLAVVVLFVSIKIVTIFYHKFDPFLPFENLFSAIFFGGILDAFKKAGTNQGQQQHERESSHDINVKSNDGEIKSKDNKKKD